MIKIENYLVFTDTKLAFWKWDFSMWHVSLKFRIHLFGFHVALENVIKINNFYLVLNAESSNFAASHIIFLLLNLYVRNNFERKEKLLIN